MIKHRNPLIEAMIRCCKFRKPYDKAWSKTGILFSKQQPAAAKDKLTEEPQLQTCNDRKSYEGRATYPRRYLIFLMTELLRAPYAYCWRTSTELKHLPLIYKIVREASVVCLASLAGGSRAESVYAGAGTGSVSASVQPCLTGEANQSTGERVRALPSVACRCSLFVASVVSITWFWSSDGDACGCWGASFFCWWCGLLASFRFLCKEGDACSALIAWPKTWPGPVLLLLLVWNGP
jgi:hypothetical protein